MPKWRLHETAQGGFDGSSTILKVDSSIAYRLKDAFHIDGGLPVYVVRGTQTTGPDGFVTGIGNAYLRGRYNWSGEKVFYDSTLTATAPTGSRDKGLTTGRVTVEWENRIARKLPGFAISGAASIANTVSDTPFFVRPFSSLGFVTRFEGGGDFSLAKMFPAGGSVYVIRAAGDQTIVSRVTRPGSSGPSSGTSRRVFESSSRIVTTASEANDHGFSVWIGWFGLAKQGLFLQSGTTAARATISTRCRYC
jgi:hypothetical protein